MVSPAKLLREQDIVDLFTNLYFLFIKLQIKQFLPILKYFLDYKLILEIRATASIVRGRIDILHRFFFFFLFTEQIIDNYGTLTNAKNGESYLRKSRKQVFIFG